MIARFRLVLVLPFIFLCGCGSGGGGGGGSNVSVRVAPVTTSLSIAAAKTFTATVSNATNTGVTWSVQEGAAGGSIDSSGNYTAPKTPGTYHVIATSKQDTSKTDIATLTVQAGSASGSIL